MTRLSDIKSLPVSDAVRKLNPEIYGLTAKPGLGIAKTTYSPPLVAEEPSPGPRYRSKWEREFHEILKARFKWVEHEPLRLKIGRNAYYKPDFLVVGGYDQNLDALHPVNVVFYEVKGHWREAARVRIKVAASKYPWARFIAVVKQKKKDGGGWKEEAFQP